MTESPATVTPLPALDLHDLIGSRICHDLISPIGAIGNGVELLMMDGGAKSPEMALIAESVAHANARIRFYRVAFGATTADQRIGSREIGGILSDLTRGGRLAVEWHGAADLSRAGAKMAFLAFLCLEHALPLGGRIVLAEESGRWRITGSSVRLRIEPDLWAYLVPQSDRAPAPVSPAQVQFALLPRVAREDGRRIAVEQGQDAITIAF